MSRAAIVAAARGWVGTPYVHQASCKGGGCDCLGLVRGVWRQLCGAEPELPPAYSADWSEAGGHETLWLAARRHLIERADLTPVAGAVCLFRLREGAVAKHLGIVTGTDPSPAFVHAYSGHGVVESPLSGPWRRRIAAMFDFPFGRS